LDDGKLLWVVDEFYELDNWPSKQNPSTFFLSFFFVFWYIIHSKVDLFNLNRGEYVMDDLLVLMGKGKTKWLVGKGACELQSGGCKKHLFHVWRALVFFSKVEIKKVELDEGTPCPCQEPYTIKFVCLRLVFIDCDPKVNCLRVMYLRDLIIVARIVLEGSVFHIIIVLLIINHHSCCHS